MTREKAQIIADELTELSRRHGIAIRVGGYYYVCISDIDNDDRAEVEAISWNKDTQRYDVEPPNTLRVWKE